MFSISVDDIMKIKKIKIGGHEYKLKIPYEFQESLNIEGQIVFKCGEIRIATTNKGEKMKPLFIVENIIHEILHGIEYIYNLEIFKHERDINRFAHAILLFLVENNIVTVKNEEDK